MGWLDLIFGARSADPSYDPDADLRDEDWEGEPAIQLTVTDVLDLHSFPPKQVKDVVRSYLDEAADRGFDQVRIIHGRGVGVQRRLVRSLLEHDPRVLTFGDAPETAGGWGATVARLKHFEPATIDTDHDIDPSPEPST